MGATIDDIAREAGVSTATVSRVVNNPELVKPETCERVEEVIRRLGYRPNIFARGLMRSRTDSVGILVSYLTNPYITAIVDSIERTLSRNHTYLYLCNSNDDIRLEREYADELLRRNVDALIVVETPSFNRSDSYFVELEADCPVILVNEHVRTDSRHHIVACEQEPGLGEALRHLLSRDRFPIALFVGNEKDYSFILKERLFSAFRTANALSEADALIYRLGDSNVEEIVTVAARLTGTLIAESRRPRAILAGNDMIGVGVLQAALAAGLRVPEDLAIIGVDNTLLSRVSMPSLSTVDLRTEDVGRMAAELFLRIRAGRIAPDAATRETIPSFLIHRATS
jgi:LacI family transcriptional regulator